MKNLFLSALAISALLFTSCGSDDDGVTPVLVVEGDDTPTVTETTVTIDANITEDTTFTSDVVWTLDGIIAVEEGVTLTIEPGTIIKGAFGTGVNASALIIAQGAKIMAEGTATEPIIFTSAADNIAIGETESTVAFSSNSRGLWGGVAVLGYAPISASGNAIAGSNGALAQIEGVADNIVEGRYGGSDSTDNSGVLKYVSIRYAGTDIATDNELNGLTLGGVGSGTTIEYIEVYAGFDDGVEFFGGSVDATNIVVNGQGDDAIDADQGYSGTISNALVISNDSNSGFELDGPEAALLADSFFTIENATLIGGSNARIAELKSGCAATISNVLALDYTTEEIQINGGSAYTNFTDGDTVLSDWEIVDTRDASTIVTSDESDSVTNTFLSVIAAEADATVGATTSVFDGWTQSSILGDY